MTLENIIERMDSMVGNVAIEGSVYISSKNMRELLTLIRKNKKIMDIFLTPYLVAEKGIYELLHYEFGIEIQNGISKSIKKQYHKNNCLPKKVTDVIYPGIIVNENQYEEAICEIEKYLNAMDKIDWSDEKNFYDELRDSELCYQIF